MDRTFGVESTAVCIVDSNPAADISNLAPFSATGGVRVATQSKRTNTSSKPVTAYKKSRLDAKITSSAGLKFRSKNSVVDISLGLDNIGISKTDFGSNDINSTWGFKIDLTRMQVGIETSTTKISWTEDKQIDTTDYTYCNVSIAWIYSVFAFSTLPYSETESSDYYSPQRQPA